MKKPAKLGAISALLLCLCVLGIFVPVVTARDAFVPSWLVEGAYVKYEPTGNVVSSSGGIGFMAFFNLSNPKFAGTNYTIRSEVRRCI